MSNKVIYIASIFTAALYAVIQIMGFCVPEVGMMYAMIDSMLLLCLLALFSAIVVLPGKNKKFRVACLIIAGVELLLSLVFCVNTFVGFTNKLPFNIRYAPVVFVGLLVLTTIGLMLIDTESSSFLTKITSSICLIVLLAISVAYISNWTRPTMAALSMTGAAVSINLLAPRFGNKAAQAVTSIASLVFVIVPVVYLIRGYIGFTVAVTNVLVIFSVLVSLVCTICIAAVGIKSERQPAAPQTY